MVASNVEPTHVRSSARGLRKVPCISRNEGGHTRQTYWRHDWARVVSSSTQQVRQGQIGSSPKSAVERLVDQIYALPVLGFIGSLPAPDEATRNEESRVLQRHQPRSTSRSGDTVKYIGRSSCPDSGSM